MEPATRPTPSLAGSTNTELARFRIKRKRYKPSSPILSTRYPMVKIARTERAYVRMKRFKA
jgi:hypothetical protein